MSNFDACLAHVLRHEGGFADHPSDPGGATNMGITHKTLAAWRGASVTTADVRALTQKEAAAIYRANYWNVVHADDLPLGVDLSVFDFAVNSGPARAVRHLQAVVGTARDGAIGPITLGAVADHDPVEVVQALNERRLDFMRDLSTWQHFGRGWQRRVDDVTKAATAMARGEEPEQDDPPEPVAQVPVTLIGRLLEWLLSKR